MHIPTTSTTLLREIAHDSHHARWSEFVARYRPMMEAFLRERFPMIDADDVIQETLVALCAALPSYHYVPGEKGHFHNYLTGILRNKALRHLHREKRQTEIADAVGVRVPSGRDGRAVAPRSPSGMMADDESSWREAILEIALQQLLSNESIRQQTRQVFLRVAVNGEKPEEVAAAFGMKRNAVDQIRSRMMVSLRSLVAALEKVDGE